VSAPLRYATCVSITVLGIWRKPIDSFLKFAQEFEKHFVNRSEDEDRAIIRSHAIAWQRLSLLPPEILTHAGEAGPV
jgi:vacuolar-type H+-ATPase subunit B/Vma2